MAFQKAVQKGGRGGFWVPPPGSFSQGVSAILACVFLHPVDPGQGGICQEGKQLPKAVTRVQTLLAQFGIFGVLLSSVPWGPHFPLPPPL